MLSDSIILPNDFKWISVGIGKMKSHFEQVKAAFSIMERLVLEKDVLKILKMHEE